jgi:hypothetical protein
MLQVPTLGCAPAEVFFAQVLVLTEHHPSQEDSSGSLLY